MLDILNLLLKISLIVFVLASMFRMGLSLTMKQIMKPMKNVSLVLRSLLTNFFLSPLLALLIITTIGLNDQLAIGLLVLSISSGAPLLAKYVQIAKGDLAYASGLTVLLSVSTIIFLPLIMPLVMPGIIIDTPQMLKTLILTILIPLIIGLIVRSKKAKSAKKMLPGLDKTTSLTLLAQIVLGFALTAKSLLGIVGTGAIIASIVFILGNLFFGWMFGGPKRGTKVTLSLGTGQRNASVAMLVVVQNFVEPNVLLMVLTVSIGMLIFNTISAKKMAVNAVKK